MLSVRKATLPCVSGVPRTLRYGSRVVADFIGCCNSHEACFSTQHSALSCCNMSFIYIHYFYYYYSFCCCNTQVIYVGCNNLHWHKPVFPYCCNNCQLGWPSPDNAQHSAATVTLQLSVSCLSMPLLRHVPTKTLREVALFLYFVNNKECT